MAQIDRLKNENKEDREENITNYKELKKWRDEAEQLGRSRNHLAKIDQVINSTSTEKNQDNPLKIDERDFKAMQKDRSDFLELNQNQEEQQNQTQSQAVSRGRRR